MLRMWLDQFVSWIYTRRMYGPRCDEFERTCHCCKAWRFHDEVFRIAKIKSRREP